MTASFSLNLPTDIPWERICVTKDMMDDVVCDRNLPGKWRTSIVVFKYVPAEEYQLYPKYKITYLKVTATVTGYQPINQEIQGSINWNGVNVEAIDGVTDLLNTYLPCHGAILQVVVGPKDSRRIPTNDLPFFLEFEPKKRELYEMATDTKELQSRSTESLNIAKSGGTANSMEVLDIDQGSGGGGGVSVFGTGGSFNLQHTGQWGTKNLNTQESMIARTADASQEKRESQSHTTQLAQMYHLLDSYHLGTNRAVFFIQPRPHVLEEPSGFVRGPRPVDGIQEFFLVVAQPKDQEDFCVSVRLDTSHLTEIDIMDYERRTDQSEMASVTVPVPTDSNNRTPAGGYSQEVSFFWRSWTIPYHCYTLTQTDNKPYSSPWADYKIDLGTNGGFLDQINEADHGSTSVTVSPDGESLNVHVEATSHICEEGSGVCLDCPDVTYQYPAHARRQVNVYLISRQPIRKIGTQQMLVVTTRGLCCCPADRIDFGTETVTTIKPLPAELGGAVLTAAGTTGKQVAQAPAFGLGVTVGATGTPTFGFNSLSQGEPGGAVSQSSMPLTAGHSCAQCGGKPDTTGQLPAGKQPVTAWREGEKVMTPQQANAIGDFMRKELVRTLTDPRPELRPKSYLHTDLFAKQMVSTLQRFRNGRVLLSQPLAEETFRPAAREKLEEYFHKSFKTITRYEIISMQDRHLSRLTDLSTDEIASIKLNSLGVEYKEKDKEEDSYSESPAKNKSRPKKSR